MATIVIDNRPFELPEGGANLLEVCLTLGFHVPYFCWHPAMHSVGACRLCAVKQFKDADDTKGRLIMACMTQPSDGMRISIDDPEAVEFRAKVLEWLMLNHPHDCPVCDEGGECHLQDMTVMTGHVYRRSRFRKRTHRNQDLGPFVNHEMNRCIQCYRCVRFYRDFAGGRDFGVFGWHDGVYFGRHADGALESEFAGNLVEVCPTGVFTDKTLKAHYTRKWDLQTAPSICVHCGLGCNTTPGERYGTLRRVRSRFHHEINRYFLCDRGRFGYEFVNSERRIRTPLVRREGGLVPAGRDEAVGRAAELLAGGRAIGIGSPRASLESNYALHRLVGDARMVHGMSDVHYRLARLILRVLRTGAAPGASLLDADQSDAVLVLGEDVINTAPLLGLALRQAVLEKPMREAEARQKVPAWDDAILREAIQQKKGPFFVASPDATKLDDLAAETFRAAPADLARLGFAVAHAIDGAAPDAEGLPQGARDLAGRVAAELTGALRPLVVSGITCGSEALIEAAANVAWALHRRNARTHLCFTVPECNSMGLAMMPGESIDEALRAIRTGQADTVVVVENDVYRHFDDECADELLGSARHVIAIDSVANATTEKAEVVLPAATFAECSGTLVNNEGRAQRFFQVFQPPQPIQASWRWLGELVGAAEGGGPPWEGLDAVIAEMERHMPQLAGVAEAAPAAEFRILGRKVPRQPARYSGRTAMHADVSVHEPAPPPDGDSPLAHSMEGTPLQPPAALLARCWQPAWNSPNAVSWLQQRTDGPLRGGPAGRKLLAAPRRDVPEYFAEVPPAFVPVSGEWLFLPAYHCFGSDELSVHTPGVAALAPRPYVAVGPGDAEKLALSAGARAVVDVEGRRHELPVVIRASLPAGVAVLPAGLAKLPGVVLPAWGHIRAAGAGEAKGGAA